MAFPAVVDWGAGGPTETANATEATNNVIAHAAAGATDLTILTISKGKTVGLWITHTHTHTPRPRGGTLALPGDLERRDAFGEVNPPRVPGDGGGETLEGDYAN
jgi:hypothetical protein